MRRSLLPTLQVQLCALAAALCAQVASLPAGADVTFYTDESEWRAAAGVPVQAFDTTSANVGLATEASGPPGPNTAYGSRLTFPRANTGLCRSVAIETGQYGAAIVFDDDGPAGSDPLFDAALSIGEIGSGHTNDDFWIAISDGAPTFAFGFYVAHNTSEASERLFVMTWYGMYQFNAAIPDASGSAAFIGAVSDAPITHVYFDEHDGSDELALKDLRFDDAAADRDGDGLDNCSEATVHGTDPTRADMDGDGLSDREELEASGTDPRVYDSDGDGLSDGDEVGPHATDPLDPDTDGDDLRDGDEIVHGTDPNDVDSDGDGLRDGFEVRHDFDPLAPGDGYLDPDGDGLENLAEQEAGTDPNELDSDRDALGDGDELRVHGTDPRLADTDADGLRDGFEVANGFDPLSPGEGQLDPDGDGMRNLAEQERGTDPHDPDTDEDGLSDGAETSRVVDLDFGAPSQIIANAAYITSLLAEDFDRDGDRDLATAQLDPYHGNYGVFWYANRLGSPSGDFAPGMRLDYDSVATLSAADLDGDHDVDLLQASGGSVFWFANRVDEPSADFAPAQLLTGWWSTTRSVLAADLDGDGDLDPLYLANDPYDDSMVSIVWHANRLREAQGDFGPPQIIAGPESDPYPNRIFAADFDRDGDTDILARTVDGIGWYENRLSEASADFVPYQSIANLESEPVLAVSVSDVDGDGDADVLASLLPNTIVWFENRLREASADFAQRERVSAGSSSALLAAADLDSDGDPDVVAASQTDGKIAWHENRIEEPIADLGPRRVLQGNPDTTVRFLITADLDGDGDADVLSAPSSGYGQIRWHENPGTNPTDPDSDDDGLRDGFEVAHAFDPNTPGEQSQDPDGDGLTNAGEQTAHTNPRAADTDGDGLSDDAELNTHRTDPMNSDSDDDGLSDGAEIATYGTDPNRSDTDSDGLPDSAEITAHGTDPNTSDSDGDGLSDSAEVNTYETNPNAGDSDGDGLSDGAEIATYGSDPNSADTDGDGLSDGFEVAYGFDPRAAGEQTQDSDGDGLDNQSEQAAGTNPHASDTDGDGLSDSFEIANGFDPRAAGEQGKDPDGDGLDNQGEQLAGTDPRSSDTDGDGLSDGAEVLTHGSNPHASDTDGDGLSDSYEVAHGFDPRTPGDQDQDPDGDGVINQAEQAIGTDPRDADTDDDDWSDGEELAARTNPLHPGSYPLGFAWASIGDPGNAADSTGYGAVDYEYEISKFEVTVRQYVAFLNAVASAQDPNGLFDAESQITRSVVAGSWRYAVLPGAEEMPVDFVSLYDAMRFVNWLHNGQPVGDQDVSTTEDGAYAITEAGIAANSIALRPSARFALPSEDEWYKAAHYDAASGSWFAYPTGASTPVACAPPSSLPDTANCGHVVGGDVTVVGSYPESASPSGTFDQGGNVWEWTDEPSGANRRIRGGSFTSTFDRLAAGSSGAAVEPQDTQVADVGFRVVPEPSALASLTAGVAALLALARRRRQAIDWRHDPCGEQPITFVSRYSSNPSSPFSRPTPLCL